MTILAIPTILGGIVSLFFGFIFVAMGALETQYDKNFNIMYVPIPDGFGFPIAFVLFALAIASFSTAWGLIKGKRWAWSSTVILTIISIIFGIIFVAFSLMAGDITNTSGSIVGIIIDGIILWYLHKQNVKQYFGKLKTPTA